VNVSLRLPAIPNGLADLHHPVVEWGLTDEALRPDVFQEFLTGDDAVAMLDEIAQNRKGLRLQGAWDPGVAQFVELGIKCEVIEQVQHHPPPGSAPNAVQLCV